MGFQIVIHPPRITYSAENSILNMTVQFHSTENETIYIITVPSRDNEIINTILLLLPGVMRSYCFMAIFPAIILETRKQ